MSSGFEDPSQWRLTTAGGIKFKQKGFGGNFNQETGTVQWTNLIQTKDLIPFLEESFPSPLRIGNLFIP